jgi:uncharacterized membrane protein YgdD (TMEM256/DUF423 family)
MITEQGVIMTSRQQAFALIASVALLVFIVEMVRRRKLREEYSWLWIVTGAVIFVLSIWYSALLFVTHLIGAIAPVSTLFLFGILFLVLTNIYYSIKISTLTTKVKNLAQRLAIVDGYVKELRERGGAADRTVDVQAGDDPASTLGSDCRSGAEITNK